MTINDFRVQAQADRQTLDAAGHEQNPSRATALIAARYHEAMSAIRHFDTHGRLPRWAT